MSGPHLSTAVQDAEQRLCVKASLFYAQIVILMQPKKPQIGTREDELKETARDVAFHALLRGRPEVILTRFPR
jgi:hypothetical protein